MAKVIKEIIIMLLICLVGMLLFAVIFYEYIPNRKIVPEVTEYSASDKVQELLADNVDEEKSQVVLTYEVTSKDLNNYEATNEYVPGKANPFAVVSQDVDGSTTEEPNGTNTNSGNTTNSNSNDTKNETNSYFKDTGTK